MQAGSRSDNAFAVPSDYALLGQASTVTFIMWLTVLTNSQLITIEITILRGILPA